MAHQTNALSILFVQIGADAIDAREALQGWLGRQNVERCLTIIGDVVQQHGGIVSKHSGNVLMASFASVDSAVKTGCALQEALAAMQLTNQPRQPAQVAINYGPITVEAGEMSGDTVNVGFELLKIAQDNKIVITQAVSGSLGQELRERIKDFGKFPLDKEGRDIGVYEVIWSDKHEPPKKVAVKSKMATPKQKGRLRLRYRDKDFELHGGKIATLGRGKDNYIVTGDAAKHISRVHAQVEYKDGAFILRDDSANGTYVRTTAGDVRISRDEPPNEVPLSGKGMISLGYEFGESQEELIYFTELP